MKIKKAALLIILLTAILTCLNPVYPKQQILQHAGTLILLIPLLVDLKRNKLNLSSYLGLSSFIILHIIGARYIYSYVPYNEWIKSITGLNTNDLFGFKRNHYDRFVHFAFGVLMFPFLYQWVGKWKGLNNFAKVLIVWAFIQTFSMMYELFEWALTIVMTKDTADDYNGQQGDLWDAQKDMALATLGSTVMAIGYLLKRKIK